MKIGGLTAGKKYLLKYSLRGSVDNMSISAYLRKSNSPYTDLTERISRKVSTTRSENEILFIALGSTSEGSVQFVADKQSKYYLDNIRLYEADAVITNPNDSIKFVYNATKVNKTVSLSGGYIDAKGNKFSNSITLSPYKSAVLIKTNSSVNTSPTVSITSPVSGAKYTSPATITLAAKASDADGTISQVEFLFNGKPLYTDKDLPFSCTWSKVPAGSYTFTAKATDNSGHTTTSAGILVYVVAAPTVSITSPSNNAKYTAGEPIYITAKATDANGSIKKVDFYRGTTLIKTEYTAPYSIAWTNVPAGNYTLTAKATNDKGIATTSAKVYISVISTLARSISSADTASAAEATNAVNDSTGAVSNQNFSDELISLKLGPNPATNNLNIFTSGLPQNEKLIISIYSISGVLIRTIPSSTPNQVMHLNISSLSKGVYIVRSVCGASILSRRFVKM
jgi:hypothetical protein